MITAILAAPGTWLGLQLVATAQEPPAVLVHVITEFVWARVDTTGMKPSANARVAVIQADRNDFIRFWLRKRLIPKSRRTESMPHL